MKSMKKSPKQNWESNIRRTPIILGLSAALCMPSAFSYANASDPVAGELVQSVQQGRTVTGKIIDDTGEPLIGDSPASRQASFLTNSFWIAIANDRLLSSTTLSAEMGVKM